MIRKSFTREQRQESMRFVIPMKSLLLMRSFPMNSRLTATALLLVFWGVFSNAYGSADRDIIILEKEIPFAEQLKKSNTVYVIQYDFDLNDAEGKRPVKIPKNCKLEFRDGSLKNGVIQGDDLFFEGNYDKRIFVTIKGRNITPNFRLYYTDFLCNQLSSAYANSILMEDAKISKIVQLHSGLSSLHNNRLTIDSTACAFIYDDGVFIKNICLDKTIGSKIGQRFAIESRLGNSNILIDSCYVTGAFRFANDHNIKNCHNLTISNCIIECDFTNIKKRPSGDIQKDIITVRGMSDVYILNNKITGINVHRFWKSTGLIQPDGQIFNNPTNILFYGNDITCESTDGYGKQVFDFFAGSLNVSICSNTITCSGYTIVFEDKTATGYENEVGTILFSSIPSSKVFIMNNTLSVRGGRAFRYSLGGRNDEVFISNNFMKAQNPVGVFGLIENASTSIIHNTFENMSSIKIRSVPDIIFSNNNLDGKVIYENVSSYRTINNTGHFIFKNGEASQTSN